MDKRRKNFSLDQEQQLSKEFFEAVGAGRLSIQDSVKQMRRISRLTQPEFAKHRGISLPTLRKIESGNLSVNLETLNKIADIFGLEVGFVQKKN